MGTEVSSEWFESLTSYIVLTVKPELEVFFYLFPKELTHCTHKPPITIKEISICFFNASWEPTQLEAVARLGYTFSDILNLQNIIMTSSESKFSRINCFVIYRLFWSEMEFVRFWITNNTLLGAVCNIKSENNKVVGGRLFCSSAILELPN